MKLTLISCDAGLSRLMCEGEITQNELWQQDSPLEELLGAKGYAGKVMLSLASTTYIDSAGVGWLITNHRKFKQYDGKLVLHSIPPMVNHIFQLLQMHRLLHLAKDEAAALAMLGDGQKAEGPKGDGQKVEGQGGQP